MKLNDHFSGFAIALAWPQTWCKQPNAWYDSLMLKLGISVNHYYRAGHAALVLIEKSSGICHYFDFGRYHAPFEHGRIRSAVTDHDLDLPVKARTTADRKSLANFSEILEFLHQNQACHGNGDLFGSYTEINFQKAYNKALQMHQDSPIPYGPFLPKGSNCSRFVHTVILAGMPKIKYAFRMCYKVPLTPTPMSNVNALPHKTRISALQPWELFYPGVKPDKSALQDTLPQPVRRKTIPAKAQWLSGEGAGSWFHIEKRNDDHFLVTRYSPEGAVECSSDFRNDAAVYFDPALPFEVVHLSHCAKVRLIQNGQSIILTRIPEDGSSWRESSLIYHFRSFS
jgi:hypothetical protein